MPQGIDPAIRRRNRILGVLMMFLGLFSCISLLTFSSVDSYRLLGSVGSLANRGGRLGAFLAHYLYHAAGLSALLFPLFLLLWGWNRFRSRPPGKLLRYTLILSAIGLLFSVATNAMGFLGEASRYFLGGKIGSLLAGICLRFLGQIGTYIFLAALLVILLLVTAERLLIRLLRWLQQKHALWTMRRAEKRAEKKARREKETVSQEKKAPRKKEKRKREKENKPAAPPPATSEISRDAPSPSETEPSHVDVSTGFVYPGLDLLGDPAQTGLQHDRETIESSRSVVEAKLADFGVEATVVQVNPGPVITQYELEPATGVKVSRIAGLSDDLALAMKAKNIRIVAPIPGRGTVGIEIPNPQPSIVSLKEILASEVFRKSTSKLTIGLGKTISGEPFCADLAKMPHLLIAGATGSGKSVCINSVICSILLNRTHPQDVQFLMIDPKMLELPIYNGIPHLARKVITHSEKASETLKLMVNEMENRYRQLARIGVRDIDTYNERVKHPDFKLPEGEEKPFPPLPYFVVIVDELADLMLSSFADEIEKALTRLAQMARAVGIHLILATQRPSVDVITGLIKANFPTRIAFQVASKIDSRTILDLNGAERLLGAGDMLFLTPRNRELLRIHGSYISTKETEEIVRFIKKQHFSFQRQKLPEQSPAEKEKEFYGVQDQDELFAKARELVIRHQQGSVSLLQRRLGVGYARAGRIMDQLEQAGVVGPFDGSKARQVLIDYDELDGMEERTKE